MKQPSAGAGRYVPATAAVVFAVLYGAGLSLVVGLPGVDKWGVAVVAFVRDHAAVLRLEGRLAAWGALALVVLFPRWLGILAAVFAIEQLAETVTIVGGPGQFISPGGPMNYDLGGALFIVFFVALGL